MLFLSLIGIVFLLYLVYVIFNLFTRRFRVIELSNGKFRIQTISWLIPFYWHTGMWRDLERDFANESLYFNNFESLDEAKSYIYNKYPSFKKENYEIVKIHPLNVKEKKVEDFSYLLEGVTDQEELRVLNSIIERSKA